MKKHRLLLAAAAATLLAAPAAASPVTGVDALKVWNLIVLGDLTSTSEVEGRTFVGGNLTGASSNYQIAVPAPSASEQPGLTVIGNVIGGTKNLNNGSGAIVGGNVESGFNLNGGIHAVQVGGTISNTNVNKNQVRSGLATSDASFLTRLETQGMALAGSMKELSTSLGMLDANSQVQMSGNKATFNASPDSRGVAVFSISASDLNRIGEIAFNLNGADTAVVNVSGASVLLNDNFLGGTQGLGEHVIWNFGEAQTLDLSTAWGGSVLAPWASATTSNYIQGSAVFGDLTQNGEMHLGTYAGGYSPPVTPPPPTSSSGGSTPIPEGPGWPLFITALFGLVIGRAVQRKQS